MHALNTYLAPSGTAWDSVRTMSGPRPWETPEDGWCDVDGGDVIKLKDTGKGFYNNRFLSDVEFVFELPSTSSRWKTVICDEFSSHSSVEERRRVRLFCVANGADHDMGEWAMVDCMYARICNGKRPHVVLHRLSSQPEDFTFPPHRRRRREERSDSEARHRKPLEEMFCPSFSVVHEPECVGGLRGNMVVGGKVQTWTSQFYTPDYVLSDWTRAVHISVESKFDQAGVDATAMEKCRQIRDVGARRVFLVYDHDEKLRIIDFGGPGGGDERTYTKEEFSELVLPTLLPTIFLRGTAPDISDAMSGKSS